MNHEREGVRLGVVEAEARGPGEDSDAGDDFNTVPTEPAGRGSCGPVQLEVVDAEQRSEKRRGVDFTTRPRQSRTRHPSTEQVHIPRFEEEI